MLLGHYAAGLAAKKFAPKTNAGLLVAAAVLLDLLWPVFLSLGLESVVIVPGTTLVTPLFFLHYPWSHSLYMAVVWGTVFAALYYALTRYRDGAIVLGLLVVSHWLLDFPMHRPDLPVTPWSDALFGLSLWNNLPATLAIEFGLFAAGLYVYARATEAKSRFGRWGLVLFAVLAAALYLAAVFGPPPPNVPAIIIGGAAAQGVFILLALWMDRARQARHRD
jgi:hypothetical protein